MKRVFMGGYWVWAPRDARLVCRRKNTPKIRTQHLGFRVVRKNQ
jgi:formylglycine-generating enzyme required for sulfatase activity